MANFNRVLLLGNLTRDPQLRFLPTTNTAVCDFGLAVSRKFRTAAGEDREEVTFVDCSAFAKTGELINQYCQKGRPLFIEGRLKLDQWEDKNGGGKRSKLTVVVENFQFIGSRDGGQGGGGGGEGGYSNQGGGGGYQGGGGGYQGGQGGQGGYDAGGYGDPGYESGPPQRAPVNRGAAPQRGPQAGPSQAGPSQGAQGAPDPRQQPSAPAEPPFSDEQHFEKDDIPF